MYNEHAFPSLCEHVRIRIRSRLSPRVNELLTSLATYLSICMHTTMGHWYSPMGSPCPMVQWDGMDRWDGCTSHGTLVQSHGISPCPMVQWDGMDRWDGCTSHGTLVQSHGIPLSHGTVGRDGQVGWLPQPWDIGTVPWDPLVPWYNGTGWTGGMAAPAMGHWYSPMGSPCPMVQWDGMDRWDGCTSHGTMVQSHGIPLSHGTMGRDEQVGWLPQPWDIGTVPWDPLVPWYSGTGWTGEMAAPAMGHWYSPMGSPCPMVQWDGMDRWDGCPSHGTLVQSHGIPLSHGTMGRDGQVGWLSQPWDIGTVPWDPLVPWYSGTGWKGGMGLWYNPMGSPCPMVQWDGMDRWDGKVVQSHGIPCVPWDKWESQIPNGHSLATLDITRMGWSLSGGSTP